MHNKFIQFIRSDYGIAFCIALLWQLAATVLGYMLSPDKSSPFAHTMFWDGGWYSAIIHDQYQTNHASAAFYPLFPLLTSLVSFASFSILNISVAAQLINLFALTFGIVALIKISRFFIPENYRFLPVVFLLISPAAFFMHMFYAEALFIAIGFWAYLFALKGKWSAVGLLLAALTASRLPALLFIGLCGLEFLRAYQWNLRKAINPQLAYFLLAPLGFIAYGSYLYGISGNFFGMFSAYSATSDWPYQVFNPNIFETIARAGYEVLRAIFGFRVFDLDIFINHAVPLFMLILLLLSSFYLIVKLRGRTIPLGIFGLVAIIFFTLNNNLVSVHRYILPCLGIYLALAHLYVTYTKIRIPLIVLGGVFLALQLYLLSLFVSLSFAG